MVNGKKQHTRVMLSLIVGTIVGHTGRVLLTRSYPSEKWVYLEDMFQTVLVAMKQHELPPPKIVWVDDWKKWHSLLETLLQEMWPGNASPGVVGQDWAHFQHMGISFGMLTNFLAKVQTMMLFPLINSGVGSVVKRSPVTSLACPCKQVPPAIQEVGDGAERPPASHSVAGSRVHIQWTGIGWSCAHDLLHLLGLHHRPSTHPPTSCTGSRRGICSVLCSGARAA